MKKLAFGLLSSRMNLLRQSWVRETWGRDCDITFYSDHSDPKRNVVLVSKAQHYKSNEEKHINFLNQVAIHLADRYEWIFCGDDDTFVFAKNLDAFLASGLDPGCVYGKVDSAEENPDNPIFTRVDPTLRYPAGGCGYLISSQLIKRLHPFTNFAHGYSDVSFGLNLREKGIPLVDRRDLFFPQAPDFYHHTTEQQGQAISYHYIKTREAFASLSRVADLGEVDLSDRDPVLRKLWIRLTQRA